MTADSAASPLDLPQRHNPSDSDRKMAASLEWLASVFRNLLGQEAIHSGCAPFRLDCLEHDAALW